MKLRLVNPDAKYAPPAFAPPPGWGYLHIAAAVAPPAGTPFVRRDSRRAALLAQLKQLGAELETLEAVRSITVYRGVLIAPAERVARFDVAVLIETTTIGGLDEVRAAEPYRRLLAAVSEQTSELHVMAARCLRSLGEVDRSRPGLFLFNHFACEDAEVAIELWEHLAGWYVCETGLDNSTLLTPISEADYVLVNHARWEMSLPRLAFEQFSKKTFRSYVTANLRANHTVAMPVLYRLA